jgi:hypothetical protein
MSNGEFETPGAGPGSEQYDTGEFQAPDSGDSFAAEIEQADIDAVISRVSGEVLAAKAQIEKYLCAVGAEAAAQSDAVMKGNIVGVGIGTAEDASGRVTGLPGEPVLEIYAVEPQPAQELKARVAAEAGVSALASPDFPVHVVVTGIVDAYPHRMRLRPAPGGISVGHKNITAGTLGCLVRGRHAPRNARLMILSNNHVLANSNAASIGDCISQPGPYDGGRCPADQVAVLEKLIPIRFGGPINYVDCATGWAWPDRVRRELMYLQAGAVRYFRVGGTPVAAVPGLAVGKSGRTTQLTSGRVTAVGVTIRVSYGSAGSAVFSDQMAIRAASGDFSAGGDSGSLIWTWDSRRAPVGLLFAGGGGTTFANRIGRVLDALEVNFYT